MKKLLLFSLIFLVVAPILVSAYHNSTVSISSASHSTLDAMPGLPEKLQNATPIETTLPNASIDYLNTTNPCTNMSTMSALDEIREREGNHPIYVLVFGDEEERAIWRQIPGVAIRFLSWDSYSAFQIERGDNALTATFGIDVRIIDILSTWNSNNSLTSMYELWDDLKANTKSYLRKMYYGQYWSNYVDCVIGITAQSTTENIAGLASDNERINNGDIFILLKWQAYWADDNLVQHEVSHVFRVDDHEPTSLTCCVMASHTHFQYFIWEDALWAVFDDVLCAYTSYSWCSDCTNTINASKSMYQTNPYDPPLLIEWWNVYPYEPRTMYRWLDELTGNNWTEYKGAVNPAIRIP
jgi:hypothetical protein